MQSGRAETLQAVRTLTNHFEQGRPQPWADTDAPEEHIEALLKTIVGIEIAIERIEAKQKYSQNRPEPDQQGVLADLESQGPAARDLLVQMQSVLSRPPLLDR